jgi:hypothetical protein
VPDRPNGFDADVLRLYAAAHGFEVRQIAKAPAMQAGIAPERFSFMDAIMPASESTQEEIWFGSVAKIAKLRFTGTKHMALGKGLQD